MGQEELAKFHHHHEQQQQQQQLIADCQDDSGVLLQQQLLRPLLDIGNINSGCCSDRDGLDTVQLLVQAHVLLRKNVLYQRIDQALRKQIFFHSTVYETMTTAVIVDDNNRVVKDAVTPALRDSAVSNIRFLSIFYSCPPDTFSVATNLLDRLLAKVKVHSKYLLTIATCCFYIAARLQQADPESGASDASLPPIKRDELLKLSQCGDHTTLSDLIFTECQILDLVPCEPGVSVTTSLSFLQLFYEMCTLGDLRLMNSPDLYTAAVAKLEVLTCSFDFTQFRADVLALALLDCILPDLTNTSHLSTIVELQYYCQMYDGTYGECVTLIKRHLQQYDSQPTKVPRLKLSWSISRRVLHKMKPSTRVQLDLEPIIEDADFDINTFQDIYTELQCDRNDFTSQVDKLEVSLSHSVAVGADDERVEKVDVEEKNESLVSLLAACDSEDVGSDGSSGGGGGDLVANGDSKTFDGFTAEVCEAEQRDVEVDKVDITTEEETGSSSTSDGGCSSEESEDSHDGATDKEDDEEDYGVNEADDDEVFSFQIEFSSVRALPYHEIGGKIITESIAVGCGKKACYGSTAVAMVTCAQCYQSASQYLGGGRPGGGFSYNTNQLVLCHCDDNNNQVAA